METKLSLIKKIPAGYKQTELGVIPEDWEVKSLDDLFLISGGFSASRAQLSDDGFCYLHYGDIHKSKRTYIDIKESFSEIPKLNISAKLIPKKSILNNGDVVFVDASEDDEGASKHIVIYNTDDLTYISGLHTIVLKSKDDSIENIYKQYCFQTRSIKEQFKFYAVGTKVTGISKTNIAKIRLTYPPKPEQTAIATVLSDTDALIECLGKLIAKKKAIKQGTMQQLLTGKKRLPGFSGEWEVKKLPKVVWFQEGPGVRNSQFTNSGVKLLNGTNIEDGKLLLEKTDRYISEKEAFGWYSHFLVDDGDILIACSGVTIDKFQEKVTIASQVHLPLCMNTSTMRFKIVSSILSKDFFFHFLKSKSFKEQIGGKATGSAQLNFGPSHVKMVELALPKPKEQTAIATILSDMDAEIESLEQKRDKYTMLKQGMMQQLLTGRIRIYANN